jgi:hypothetical protein
MTIRSILILRVQREISHGCAAFLRSENGFSHSCTDVKTAQFVTGIKAVEKIEIFRQNYKFIISFLGSGSPSASEPLLMISQRGLQFDSLGQPFHNAHLPPPRQEQ